MNVRTPILTLIVLITALTLLPYPVHAQHEYPLLKKLRDAGLITDLNLSQTKGDITATLDWAYADVNMLAVQATIVGLPPLEMPQDPDAHFPYQADLRLTDQDGNLFLMMGGGGTSIEYPADGTINLIPVLTTSSEVLAPDGTEEIQDYFTATYGENLPETIDLKLEISIQDFTQPEKTFDPFLFDFTVPLRPAVVLESDLSTETSGVSITLNSIKVSPGQTNAEFCYDASNDAEWQPQTTLLLGDVEALPISWGDANLPSPTGTPHCFTAMFSGFYDPENVHDVTLTVDRLLTAQPTEDAAFWEKVTDILAEQGIDLNVTMEPNISFGIENTPAGMTDEEAWHAFDEARLSLREAVDGPWTFTVNIPE